MTKLYTTPLHVPHVIGRIYEEKSKQTMNENMIFANIYHLMLPFMCDAIS